MNWSVGVTTVAARRHTLLPRTLASLHAAGWERPRLFVDGDDDGSSWARQFGLPITCRGGEPSRVAANWTLCAWELYLRHPNHDHYLIVQDDVLLLRDLKPYLERSGMPRGYLNLFSYRENEEVIHGKKIGWHEAATLPKDRGNERPAGTWQQCGRGALALAFPREALQALLSSPHMVHRARGHNGWRSIDGGIVESLNRCDPPWREYVHCPTLSTHTGTDSTILLPRRVGKDLVYEPKGRSRNTLTWMGERFSALKFLEGGGGQNR